MHRRKKALAAVLAVAVLAGCTGNTPTQPSSTMDLSQIAEGNYRSLLGTWVESAYGANFGHDGTGVQWHAGGSSVLWVSADRIVASSIVIHEKTLSDKQSLTNAELVFTRTGKYLTGGLVDESVIVNYAVYFYPRGVAADLMLNNGVKIFSSANRIVIWSSNNSFTEVFSEGPR